MLDFDALLLLSFGGPEGPEQVRPFLENVTRGRGIPPERLDDVAEHYLHFGGVSPINGINRALIEQIGPSSPPRHRPAGLLRQPQLGSVRRGHRRRRCATTAFGARRCSPRRRGAATRAARSTSRTSPGPARAAGEGAPELVKLRQYFDHPLLVEMFAEAIAAAARRCPTTCATTPGWSSPRIRFRSRPTIALRPDLYSRQVAYASRLVAAAAGYADYDQVWQSRSGPPQVPWLEPDVGDHLSALAEAGTTAVIVCPIGFVADHIEVVWDLDNELRRAGATQRASRSRGRRRRTPTRGSRAWPST